MIVRRPAPTSVARAPRFAAQQARPAVAHGRTLQPAVQVGGVIRNGDRMSPVVGLEVAIVGRNRRQR